MLSDVSSMRVLLAERALDGHRKTYMEWLSKIDGNEAIVGGVLSKQIRKDDAQKRVLACFTWTIMAKR